MFINHLILTCVYTSLS